MESLRWRGLSGWARYSRKGIAHYYDVVVNDQTNRDTAWVYYEPKAAAQRIENHIALRPDICIET